MKEENAALCRALSSLTGVSVSPIYPDSPEQFYDEACAARFCRECPYQQKNEFNTHLYGLSEAYRWDGHFIYYCPKAMVFVAAAILDGSGSLGGGMIAGPIVMGDIQDITCYTEYPYSRSAIEQLPRMTTLQVRQLALLLSASASSLHHSSFEQKRSYDQQQFLNAIYDMRSKYMDEKEHYDYILSAENQLCELIRKQDRAGSQDLLNRLLGHIFFYHAGNISDIKARTLELIVIISRSVISSGADVGDIFRYSAAYMQEIDHCDSVDQLSRWLSAVIEQFIAVSFDYADIRHSDIVFKTMDYIRSNCLRRITLEEIAGEVYLSKSYLSSIFKQETGMSITDYINQARVNHSKKLLTATAMPLIDIANECCFGDQSYFSRVFKKYQGVSPKSTGTTCPSAPEQPPTGGCFSWQELAYPPPVKAAPDNVQALRPVRRRLHRQGVRSAVHLPQRALRPDGALNAQDLPRLAPQQRLQAAAQRRFRRHAPRREAGALEHIGVVEPPPRMGPYHGARPLQRREPEIRLQLRPRRGIQQRRRLQHPPHLLRRPAALQRGDVLGLAEQQAPGVDDLAVQHRPILAVHQRQHGRVDDAAPHPRLHRAAGTAENVQQVVAAEQAGGLQNDALHLPGQLPQQLPQRHLQRAAHAAAGDIPYRRAAAAENGAVHTGGAELVLDDAAGDALTRQPAVVCLQKRGLSRAQEPRYHIQLRHFRYAP